MTNDEIRIAIAESQGWTNLGLRLREAEIILKRVAIGDPTKYPPPTENDKANYLGIPDYPSDLNAMHEVEKMLSDDEYHNYIEGLYTVCVSTAEQGMKKGRCRIMSATAYQRARTYLILNGLWK